MKKIFILLSIILVSGCMTQKRAIKQLKKIETNYPELIAEKNDTIVEVWEITREVPIKSDTMHNSGVWDDSKIDTFYRTEIDSFYKVDIRFLRDTFIKYDIRTVRFPDTVEIVTRDTIDKVINTTEYVTETTNKIPWYIWVILVGLSVTTLFLTVRKK